MILKTEFEALDLTERKSPYLARRMQNFRTSLPHGFLFSRMHIEKFSKDEMRHLVRLSGGQIEKYPPAASARNKIQLILCGDEGDAEAVWRRRKVRVVHYVWLLASITAQSKLDYRRFVIAPSDPSIAPSIPRCTWQLHPDRPGMNQLTALMRRRRPAATPRAADSGRFA
ncbi:uncharacterized protein LOC125179023 [Hyalella azteca]|uniref:Uncharacterized protein LOC125179023 n=1 Tax=Hyalella azteca TaxID=294128 RepID=A0A979FS91_HYAAZ|nr:uncharacterized protein LOC125179023 [Hyalella azteca]